MASSVTSGHGASSYVNWSAGSTHFKAKRSRRRLIIYSRGTSAGRKYYAKSIFSLPISTITHYIRFVLYEGEFTNDDCNGTVTLYYPDDKKYERKNFICASVADFIYFATCSI